MVDYKCVSCGFSNEYSDIKSTPPAMRVPDDLKCPNCKTGTLEKINGYAKSFDIIGSGCYLNDHGKHAWRKHLTASEQADVYLGGRDPY